MTSSRSPLNVLVTAHRLGQATLPAYASRFSRRDFTLPQLFACLVLRQFYNLSYRRVQALLEDSASWREAIGLSRTPDHNTLCDAFATIMRHESVEAMLDELARAFGDADLLDLDDKPLAVDSTAFESHQVSRHYERRKRDKNGDVADKEARSRVVRSLPKLAVAVACGCHLILSAWTTTGLGADHPHFESVVFEAWKRAEVKTVVADAGYDSETNHRLARQDMNLDCLIPARIGRPTDKAPTTRYRGEMHAAFADKTPSVYGQRWQVETANSMMKRNYGSALRASTPQRREREMMLKVLTHNIAL
jgi:IS5 family transposase